MLTHRSSPRRPPLSAPRGQLRAAYRLSAGLSPAAVARAEAVATRDRGAPGAARLQGAAGGARGVPGSAGGGAAAAAGAACRCVLEMALADSDWRAAAFVADQLRRGFNPARMLAKGVIKAQARAAAPPPTATGTATQHHRARPGPTTP